MQSSPVFPCSARPSTSRKSTKTNPYDNDSEQLLMDEGYWVATAVRRASLSFRKEWPWLPSLAVNLAVNLTHKLVGDIPY